MLGQGQSGSSLHYSFVNLHSLLYYCFNLVGQDHLWTTVHITLLKNRKVLRVYQQHQTGYVPFSVCVCVWECVYLCVCVCV